MATQDDTKEQIKKIFDKESARLVLTGYLTASRLKLYIDAKISPALESPRNIVVEELLELLVEENTPYMSAESLKLICSELNMGKEVIKRRIAKGTPAEDGKDGQLTLIVRPFQDYTKNKELERKDVHHVSFFENVERSAVVGRVLPPTMGVAGADALGKPLQAKPGKAVKINTDSSLEVSSLGNGEQHIIARKSGYLLDDGGRLSIRSDLAIEGDIGLRTGDVDFIGTVHIKGGVLKGYKVSGEGDVTVDGNVLDALVHSRKGNVTINGVVTGTGVDFQGIELNEAHSQVAPSYKAPNIKAAGKIKMQMLQGESVEAGGDVLIDKDAQSSLIRSRGTLRLPKGRLFGGGVFVVGGVEASQIGAAMGVSTTIYLCSDIECSTEYSELCEQIQQHKSHVEMFRMQLGPYAADPKKIVHLEDQLRKKMLALLSKMAEAKKTTDELNKKRTQMISEGKRGVKIRVSFQEVMHQGTVVIARKTVFSPPSDIPGPATLEFDSENRTFKLREYVPVETTK